MAPRTTTACVSALAAVYSDAAAVAARLRARGLPVPAAALAAVEEALLLGPPVLEGACAFQTKKLEIAAKHDSGKTKHPHDDANQAQDVNARRTREVWLADNDLDEIDNVDDDDDDDDDDNDDDDYDWTSGWGSEGSLDSTDAADTASRVSARVAAASAAFVRGDAAARDRLDEIRAGLQLNALVRLRLVLLDQCAFDGRWLQAAADTARVDAVMCLARLATRVAAGGLGQGQPGLLQEPNQPQQRLQTPEPPKRAPSVTSAASSADGFRQRRSRANSAHSGGSSSGAAAAATTTTARSPVLFPPYPHPPPQLPLPQPPAAAPAAAGPTSSPAPSTSALSRAVAAGHTNSVPPAPFTSATSAPSLRASHASSTDSDYSSATTLSSRSLRSSAASHSSSAAVVTGYAYPYGYGQYSPYGSSPSTGPDELPRSRGASHSSARRATPPLSDHPISTISEHDPGVYTAPSALEESSAAAAAAAAAAATAAATATNSSSSSLSLPGTRPPLTLSTGPIDIPGRGGRPPPPMSVPLPMQQPGRQRALSSTAAPASSLGVGPAFAPMLPPPASPLPLTPGSASAVAAASAPLHLSGISMSAVSPPSPSPSQQQQQSSTRSSSFLRPIRRRGTDPPPMPSIPQISAPIPLNIPPNSSLSANLSQSAPTIDLFLPSEENGFAGFCKGAWKLQIGLRRAFRIEQRPAGMYSQVLFWRCHKCSFEGPLNNPAVHPIVPPDVNPTASGFQRTVPNDKSGRDFDQTVRVHAPSGIRFRWAFLAKSHVHSKSAAKHQAAQAQAVHSAATAAAAAAGAHASSAPTTTGSSLTSSLPSSPPASYLGPAAASGGGPTSTGYGCAGAFACIFCCVDNQAAPPVFASADTFLSHVRLHDGARVPGHRRAPPTQVLERSKCILGRVAADWEEFDVCIPPFVDAI